MGWGTTGAAVLLLVVALGVDLFWFRPRYREMQGLLAERAVEEQKVLASGQAAVEAREFVAYAQDKEEADVDWLAKYKTQDAFSVLELYRKTSGLSRRDVSLEKRERAGDFVRTEYFMSLQGSYEQAMKFLYSTEQALPFILIESLRVDALDSGDVILKLHAVVYTLASGVPGDAQ